MFLLGSALIMRGTLNAAARNFADCLGWLLSCFGIVVESQGSRGILSLGPRRKACAARK
jgi:hypothetical protein